MEQQAICPNCGAHITNMQNCEFCGSLLIRLQQQGINIAQSDYKDNRKVFPGLIKELQKNLELQKKSNYSNQKYTETAVINSYSDIANEGPANVSSSIATYERDKKFYEDKSVFPNTDYTKPHLMICFLFTDGAYASDERLWHRKFRNLDICELFICKEEGESGNKFYSYYIDFGEDTEGAARLISKILHEVYGFPYDTVFEYNTSQHDLNSDKKIETNQNNNYEDETPWYKKWWFYLIFVGLYILIKFTMCS